GEAGVEQVELLLEQGAAASRVTLSHCDRVPDVAYHRALLGMGVNLEYDHHFRTLRQRGDCPTAELIAELTADFPGQIVLGMDLARRSYWRGHGGGPGAAWLLTGLPEVLARHGVSEAATHRMLHDNPARAFAFGEGSTAS
ncbi:MAG: aryldialkylphosphatase, partial [Planctomycetota bacterium]